MYFLPYVFTFFLLVIFSYKIEYKQNKNFMLYNKIADVYFSIVVLIFFGLRGYVYTDWLNYEKFYNQIPVIGEEFEVIKNAFIKTPFEKGFFLVSLLLKSISANYFFFQFVLVFFDFFILKKIFIKYLSKNWNLCFLIFFCFYGISIFFNLLRNVQAILIFIVSLKYIEQRKFIKYLLLNIVGACFHTSSIIYIPLYFLLIRKQNKKLVLLFFIIGNIIFLLKIKWISLILNLFVGKLLGTTGQKLIGYMANEQFSSSYSVSLGFIERLVNFLLIFCYSDKLLCKNRHYNTIIILFYIYNFTWLYCSEMYIFVQRLPLLFVFSYWILIPALITTMGKKNKLIYVVFIMGIGLLKLIKDNNNIITFYDNLLFGIKTIDERTYLLYKNIDLLR